MHSSLISREVIADSTELTVRGHSYDALVGIAGCDKSLPGLMMAMLRLNVPSVFMYGGSILPGRFKDRDVTIIDVFEGVGANAAGSMSDADLHELECMACPSAGAPAVYETRDDYAVASGRAVMDLVKSQLRPRDIVTRKSFENAAAIVAATGGSTNAGLHLPAMASEAGIDFDLMDVCEIMRRTPYIADLKPGGRYVAKDLYEVGGVGIVIQQLLEGGYMHGDCMTVTGKTLAENYADVTFPAGQDVVRPIGNPISRTGGVVGLMGNLAPQGAIVKIAGLANLKFRGPARVFEREEECLQAVLARDYSEGDVLVIRNEGPKGGPGMREMLSTTMIVIDAEAGTLDVELSDEVLAERKKAWAPHPHNYNAGTIWKYTQTVGDARYGAVTHPGAKAETHVYADL